jgi:cation:H+ antiporter
MLLPILSVLGGLALLLWSADRFVEGAASTAKHLGVSSLVIGMVIVGFGTSAPEMVVSILGSMEGSPGIALGNAYGSNITNIALILGLTALLRPITVHSGVLRKELPILSLVSLLAVYQLWDGVVSRLDAIVLLVVFAFLLVWTMLQGKKTPGDPLGQEIESELKEHGMPLRTAIIWSIVGLLLLIVSSRFLVYGAVEIAKHFGISDLLIGLTVVAAGTSLPELAASIIAARKGEHEIALGNILGSNLFNTLAVVGLAGVVKPLAAEPAILSRDISVMVALTLSLFVFGYGFRSTGRINRIEGFLLLGAYVGYTVYLALTATGS